MSQEVTAQLRYVRSSPRRMRLVVDTIRGKRVVRAITILSVMQQKAAKLLLKLLKSAVANAKHDFSMEADSLFVSAITVDGGPALKRFTPKAHGRATPIRERTSHVKIVLKKLEKVAKEKTNK